MSNDTSAVSVFEAAQRLGVRPDWIYSLIWRDKIAATKTVAGTWEIPIEAVEARKRVQEARLVAEQAGR